MQTGKKFPQKYPTRNCKDTLHIGHVWSLAVFSMYVKLQSQPLKTQLVLIKYDTHHPISQIIVIRKRRKR